MSPWRPRPFPPCRPSSERRDHQLFHRRHGVRGLSQRGESVPGRPASQCEWAALCSNDQRMKSEHQSLLLIRRQLPLPRQAQQMTVVKEHLGCRFLIEPSLSHVFHDSDKPLWPKVHSTFEVDQLSDRISVPRTGGARRFDSLSTPLARRRRRRARTIGRRSASLPWFGETRD